MNACRVTIHVYGEIFCFLKKKTLSIWFVRVTSGLLSPTFLSFPRRQVHYASMTRKKKMRIDRIPVTLGQIKGMSIPSALRSFQQKWESFFGLGLILIHLQLCRGERKKKMYAIGCVTSTLATQQLGVISVIYYETKFYTILHYI